VYYNTCKEQVHKTTQEREDKEMTKTYNYIVAGTEFTDTECWGKAWQDAKALATENHKAIYRMIRVDGADTRYEVYLKAGFFHPVKLAKADRIRIF
jgi:hypothetical protein